VSEWWNIDAFLLPSFSCQFLDRERTYPLNHMLSDANSPGSNQAGDETLDRLSVFGDIVNAKDLDALQRQRHRYTNGSHRSWQVFVSKDLCDETFTRMANQNRRLRFVESDGML
jgi:hypothetical protein